MPVPPFHRLLSFYSNRSPEPDTQTIRLQDSLTGNLALGLDFPVALGVALARHLYLRNTGLFSLNIHVPSVSRTETPLARLALPDEMAGCYYTCSQLVQVARSAYGSPGGDGAGWGESLLAQADAVGLWSLAADTQTGLLDAEDVVAFQRGTLFDRMAERRRSRDHGQVLPLWRGGPLSVAAHSWMVGRVFGVQVYKTSGSEDGRRKKWD